MPAETQRPKRSFVIGISKLIQDPIPDHEGLTNNIQRNVTSEAVAGEQPHISATLAVTRRDATAMTATIRMKL